LLSTAAVRVRISFFFNIFSSLLFFAFPFSFFPTFYLKMTDHHEDDLAPTQTTGYKPGEKKSLQEYQTLDAGDESLNKWKESLGLNKSTGASKY
jgi:hypothetical protein